MWNPFKTPVAASAVSGPVVAPTLYGYPLEHYDLPATVDVDPFTPPDENGTYGNPVGPFHQYAPVYAGMASVDPGAKVARSNGYEILGPTVVDTGKPSTQPYLMPTGPASGDGTAQSWTGQNTPLFQSRPGYAGPNSGGTDQGQQVAGSYYASIVQKFSAEASAATLVEAV